MLCAERLFDVLPDRERRWVILQCLVGAIELVPPLDGAREDAAQVTRRPPGCPPAGKDGQAVTAAYVQTTVRLPLPVDTKRLLDALTRLLGRSQREVMSDALERYAKRLRRTRPGDVAAAPDAEGLIPGPSLHTRCVRAGHPPIHARCSSYNAAGVGSTPTAKQSDPRGRERSQQFVDPSAAGVR